MSTKKFTTRHGIDVNRQDIVSANNVSTNTLTALVSTGTPPLSISSTTKVDNLNVQLLDGREGSYYTEYADNANTNNLIYTNNAISSNVTILQEINETQNTIINSVFSRCNNSFDFANTGILQAQAAFAAANNVAPQIEPAYNQANTGVLQAQAAFELANNEPIAKSVFTQSNNVYNQANTGVLQAQAAFGQANTGIENITLLFGIIESQNTSISLIQNVNNTQNSVIAASYDKANTGVMQSQTAFDQANNAIANTVLLFGIYTSQNNSINLIQGVDSTQNATISAAFSAANNEPIAKSAYDQANTGILQAQAAFAAANNVAPQIEPAYNQANTGVLQAQAAFGQANTGVVQAQAAYASANTKAPLESPTLTGTPSAPTASNTTNSTQIATTAFVKNVVSNLVDSSPETLDTLNELATALGNDPNFATTVANQIGTKLNSADFTGANTLTLIKTVDGSGSGLDADLLDGQEGSYYTNASNLSSGTVPNLRLSSIPNSSLQNTTITINGTSISLGESGNIIAGAIITDDTTTNATRYLMLGSATSGAYTVANVSSTKLTFNPSTGLLGATGFSGSGASLTSIPNSALTNSSVTVNGTAISLGGSGTVTAAAGTLTGSTLASGVTASSLTSVGTITSGTWSGSFGAVSGANLTGLTAGNLSGTIPSGVLGNSTHYVGTTAIALNRASGSQTLTGVSIDGNAANITAYTINQNVGSSNSPTFAGITTSGNITRNAAGVGWLSGNYGTAETGSTTHAIYSIGGSYYPTSSSLNNMYGIGYCASTTFSGFSIANWGLYVASGGTSRHFFDSDTGNSYSSASKRAPIFYDSNNTGYYIDPNSTTSIRTVGDWRSDSSDWTGEFSGKIQYHGNNWYFQAADQWIFRNSGGSNVFYVNQSGNTYTPIVYDTNDTGYYWDGASTSKWNESNQNGWHTFNNYGLGITGTYAAERLQTVFAMGSAYRMAADGLSTSNMYGLAWSHPNAGALGGANNLNDHGLLIINAGSFRAAISSRAVFSADVRGTLFYDYNDTYYYNDLNSSRRFAGRTYIHEWIEFVNYTGLYSPNNGAHFYPNNATYGSWRSDGARNGWQGIEFGGHTTLMMNDDTYGFHKNNTGWRFYVTAGSGHFPGNVTAYWSDRRLKENLRPIGKEATDILSQLTTYRFNWNKKVKEFNLPIPVGKEEIGLIAQDVQKVLPDAVVVNKSANTLNEDGTTNEKDYLTINWDKITPLLVQSLNDTIKELNELKQKLKDNGII